MASTCFQALFKRLETHENFQGLSQQDIKTVSDYTERSVRGGVKKSGTFGWWGPFGGGVRGPTTTFGQKSTTFYFCFYSMQKPSKCVKTIKLINLCALPCLWLGLWLTLTVYFDLA